MRGLLREYYIKNNQPMAGGNSSKLGMLGSASKDPISKLVTDANQRSGSMMANKSNNDLLLDADRPKTKAELQAYIKQEKERLRVQRAADRREHWVNMVANDPDFLLGMLSFKLKIFRFPIGSTSSLPHRELQIQRFQPSRQLWFDGINYENFPRKESSKQKSSTYP
jgi:hypothetical protein